MPIYERRIARSATAAILAACSVLMGTPARAQGDLSRVYPNGGRQGTQVGLTFAGTSLPETATLFVEGEGVRALGPFTKGVGRVEIAPDAAPGVRLLRLFGPKGATTPRPFAVGVLPELEEKEPNDTPEQAQRLDSLPVTLNGALPTRPDVDTFRVALKKGQCLVVAGESRALGSPTNLVVRVRDLQGTELLVQMDSRTRDPLLPFTVPADGEYLIQLQEVLNNYSGITADYVYRLTLTTGPWLDRVFPLGAQPGVTAPLRFSGWNLGDRNGPGELAAAVSIPADAGPQHLVTAGGAPNRLPVRVEAVPEGEEQEPNATSSPQRLAVPGAISGRFGTRGDADAFRFTARAGQTLRLDVDARELGSAADPVMLLQDASGKMLASVDDAEGGRDPRLYWTAPGDGEYTLILRDVASGSRGGEDYYYRLSVAPPEPEIRLSTPAAVLTAKPGARLEIPVTVFQAYQPGPLTITAEGLPEGFASEPLAVAPTPAGTATSQMKLLVTVPPGAPPGHVPIRVVGKTAGERPRQVLATAGWELAKDRSGVLARGTTPVLSVVVPVP